MPFLSSEQRHAAIRQHEMVLKLLEADAGTLTERLGYVRELQRCNRFAIERIQTADAGDYEVDTLQAVDDCTRETLMRGIPHFPVVVASGKETFVK